MGIRLYWKVLLAVLLTMILVSVATFFIADEVRRQQFESEINVEQWQHMGDDLVSRYRRDGERVLTDAWNAEGMVLLSPAMQPLTNIPIPIPPPPSRHRDEEGWPMPPSEQMVPPANGTPSDRAPGPPPDMVGRSFVPNGEPSGGPPMHFRAWQHIELSAMDDGKPYWLAIDQVKRFDIAQRNRLPLYLAIAVALAAFCCAILTGYITRPLKALSRATRELAEGNLQSRVAEKVSSRRDELGELAKDFNTMAQRLQLLLEDQQQLLRDISHELRTPLARLQIALELARHRAAGVVERELDRIEYEGNAINELIDEVLTLVRANQPADASELVDVAELWLERVEQAQLEAEERGIRIDTVLRDQIEVIGQRRWLGRVMDNLIRNALKYSPDDSVISIALQRVGKGWEFSIADQGPGVEPEALEHLFKPFYRTDQARQTGSGYGIGLSIVERVIRFHGGSVVARNAQPSGLAVVASFPTLADARSE
ncbi:HAMP domain-containing sensor histidine kinase [Pokkaliibacter sp. MBI-7]|uniref:HAMP domain-containing sensor histidine kinase n=1 Tax=Pokkaliibacter sp. MBI-7 TaxID=3040600 RepID=UPI00244AEA25|nr:HAMP domain-containing sensor histidine kinase [Pokkaliibacter sp. MBI-7]MDH2434182.1 HAMP domain-containing sensor histidine kinase [Pokkaliibacter sp. MBI-7]